MSRSKAATGHPLAVISTAYDLDAELHRLAAVSPDYRPAGPSVDDPYVWRLLPAHVIAPHRCACGARFHVRRHLEAHTTTCTERPS